MPLAARKIEIQVDERPKVAVYVRMNRFDPTRTTFLRKAFVSAMKKRFRALRGAIRKAIIDQDCFALRNAPYKVTTLAMVNLPVKQAFNFPRNQAKVEAFMQWLQQQEEQGILEVGAIRQIGASIEGAWTDQYILDSYKRGVMRGRQELIKAGYAVPPLKDTGGIGASLSTPFHMDRLGVLYTRAFQELKGITSQMDTQISRVLTQGMADGDNPLLLAKKLTRTISGPMSDLGITDTLGRFIPAERRAEMLARTEIIRAHHQATVQEYKNWAVEGVVVKAEWVTAGYRVCPKCQELEGQVFTLDEIMNKLPLHPQCRCASIPVRVKKKKKTITEKIKKPALTKEKAFTEWKTLEKKAKELKEVGSWKEAYDLDVDGAYYRYVSTLPENEYKEERQKILREIFSIKGKKKIPPTTMKKIENGTDWMPFDVLHTLRRNGLRAELNARVSRASYDAAEVRLSTRDKYYIIAHELGHAVDDLVFTRLRDGGYYNEGTGFKWIDNDFVTKKQAEELKKEYRSLTSGKIGTYTNGDGKYHKNNWLTDYEGRIYSGRTHGIGEEWWAMNVQRYSRYKILLTEYPEETAARLSQWAKAKQRYPKLTDFIEKNFNRQFMRRDLGL